MTKKIKDTVRKGERRKPEPVVSSKPIGGELRRREERRSPSKSLPPRIEITSHRCPFCALIYAEPKGHRSDECKNSVGGRIIALEEAVDDIKAEIRSLWRDAHEKPYG